MHTLEEYCETIYQLSVSGGDRQRCKKLGKLMNRQLLSVRQGIQYRLPDEAYIHNPYDEFNLVTSVHPKFYSSELKKHVGKLIYAQY